LLQERRPGCIYQRDYSTVTLEAVNTALREGKSREEVIELETSTDFDNFLDRKTLLTLALEITGA